jgi:hypothetical protein
MSEVDSESGALLPERTAIAAIRGPIVSKQHATAPPPANESRLATSRHPLFAVPWNPLDWYARTDHGLPLPEGFLSDRHRWA